MTETAYRTAPDPNETGWPKGVKYIIGNEGCERFSFYGMKSILQVHLAVLFTAAGLDEELSKERATEMYHLFITAVYALPMLGAIISDRLAGKYHTIIWLSLVYCAGHLVLAIGENSIEGMGLGLALIAIGSGGIKPCVSAHVGDQFGKGNWNLVDKVFRAFYFIINFGSFFATMLIPYLKDTVGTSIAFGVPGVLMLIATILFWMGRGVFIHVQPKPGGRIGLLDTISSSLLFVGFLAIPLFFWKTLWSPSLVEALASLWFIVMGLWVFEERQAIEAEDGFLAVMIHSLGALVTRKNRVAPHTASDIAAGSQTLDRHWLFGSAIRRWGEDVVQGPRAVIRIMTVFFFVSVFWALFDQHGSTWIRQAQNMHQPSYDINLFWSDTPWHFELKPSQFQSANPLMVMLLIPFNTFVIYPLVERLGIRFTPLRKMSVGMFIASLAFVAVALLEIRVSAAKEAGTPISLWWQTIPYLILTQAEVMVSITGLEFAYTQAPARMKSTIMGFWLLVVALGSKLVQVLSMVTSRLDNWGLTEFFWLFAGLMAIAALLFSIRAAFYTYREYTQ